MKRLGTFLLIVLIVAALGVTAGVALKKAFPKAYAAYVEPCAAAYGLDAHLVYALMKAESNFDVTATSHKGARGLMQLTPETAAWCAEKMGETEIGEDYVVPEHNIKLGCWYLSYLDERFGDPYTAAAAYNAGLGNVGKWLEDETLSPDGVSLTEIPFPETKKYIGKIRFYEKIYDFLYK